MKNFFISLLKLQLVIINLKKRIQNTYKFTTE